ncbi:MAG: hypothetical protein A2081_03050 [Elusimicrobia bacterium GWC2_61_19]|nr:MAG: hypothetical protein A2081_03050 [Elusimicrobia bacterium GWC2_61_19]
MGPIKAKEVPPANTYDECLRRCPRCRIGATNAKSFSKIKFIYADGVPKPPTQATPPQEAAEQDAAPEEAAPQDAPPDKP